MRSREKTRAPEGVQGARHLPEKGSGSHGRMVEKLQKLIADDGLYPQIIECFPYPVAIFSPDHTLVMANRVFADVTGMDPADLVKGNIRILQYKIDDLQLASAIWRVFDGNTIFLEGVRQPFGMFSGIHANHDMQPGCYSKAVIFPVPGNDGKIGHAVIVFMP
jgi:PAS domain-containing protein